MKNITRIITSFLLIAVLANTCACSSDNKYVKDEREEKVETNSNKSPNTKYDDDNDEKPIVQGNVLDPFDGLIVEFDGISPYCTISFNNAKCSNDVQQYVEYSIEENKVTTQGKQFKLNEEVTVYASLKHSTDKTFTLAKTQQKYKVENVPEYITEITKDIDLSNLKSEAKDYFDSITAFTTGGQALDIGSGYVSHTPIQHEDSYFSVMKLNSYSKFKNGRDCFNKIDIMYSTTIKRSTYPAGDYNRYFTVCAKNIVRYPDGTIGWGKNDPNTLSFEYNVNGENLQSLINSNITSIKADFNVTKINGILP